MLTFLRLITTYWKDIAMGIVLATLFYIIFAWWGSNAEIANLKMQLDSARTENAVLATRVATARHAEAVLEENQRTASKERAKFATVLSKEINILRNQIIPKDCPSAVEFGIKHKDDLKWPGQQ